MIVPGSANSLLLAQGATPSGYNLTKSLRFRSSASAYLNKSFSATPTNADIQTISFWTKRGTLGSPIVLHMGYLNSSVLCYSVFNSDNTFGFQYATSGTNYTLTTSQVFRDPSAWYHIVIAFDSTQSTASNRTKIYVNGTQVTAFSSASYCPQNSDGLFGNNGGINSYIGTYNAASNYYDGYLTEVNFIDGQALTPSSFGENNATTGVWQPKKYTGTYGTNGFYLPFTDVATTSGSNAGLGKDFSGNGNYWNTNNISVTSGVTYDSMTDVPTLTSATTANYAVLNPLDVSGSGITLSNGNLNATCSTGSTYYFTKASQAIPTSGGFYWETTISTIGQFPIVGIQPTSRNNVNSGSVYLGYYSDEISWFGGLNEIYQNGVNILSVSSVSAGDVIMVAHNAGKTWIGKNGTWFNSGNPAAGTGNLGSTLSGQLSAAICLRGSTAPVVDANFGQRPFAYTPPTGFKALNTYNLPDSTIVAGNKVMDATLYAGAGTTQNVVNAAGFKPDLFWLKNRTSSNSHYLYDSVRGPLISLSSDLTIAEQNIAQTLTSFNSNGATLGTIGGGINGSGNNFVAWQWQAGQGSTSSNTNGSITSTVSVNASAGFSIVTYTGNSTAGATIGHGLGVTPAFFIIKTRSRTGNDWKVWCNSFNNNSCLLLNTTAAVNTGATSFLNSTNPNSTVITLGTDSDVNFSGATYVAYCWSQIAGFSKFGSYTGNGSTDGTFVYTGFRPKFVMFKRTDSAASWLMLDTSRNTYNVMTSQLYANASVAEDNTTATADFLSNGIKIRETGGGTNASGGSYIYMAFAENPFKNALAR